LGKDRKLKGRKFEDLEGVEDVNTKEKNGLKRGEDGLKVHFFFDVNVSGVEVFQQL